MPHTKRPPSKTSEVLDVCRENVLLAAIEIIDALIAKSKEGSYQHAKFLFDLLETTPKRAADKDGDDDLPGPSLAEMLIERLQLVDPQHAHAPGLAGGDVRT